MPSSGFAIASHFPSDAAGFRVRGGLLFLILRQPNIAAWSLQATEAGRFSGPGGQFSQSLLTPDWR
jgi:hypothetical protein